MDKFWIKYLPKSLRAKIEGRDYLQNVVTNTGWQLAEKVSRVAVGLIVGVWLARYLGPDQFGIFNYALAFAALFSPFASLGLEDIVVRNIVRDPSRKDETLGTAFLLSLTGGVASFVIACIAIWGLRSDDPLSQVLVAIIAAGAIFQSFDVIETWFHSQVQAKYSVFARSAAFFSCSVIKVALIVTGQPLVTFAWVAFFEVILGASGLIIAYLSQRKKLWDWRFSGKNAVSLLKDSWPLLFSGIVIIIYMRIDQVMLGEIVGTEEVGIYSVAVRLAEVWMFIPMAIFWSVYPAIIEAGRTSETLMFDRMQQLYNLMVLLAYAAAIPMTLLSHWLVGTLFGEAYVRAGLMLVFLVWANVFTSLDIARSAYLSSMNWTKIHFVTVLLGAVLNIGLNIFLIPRFGGNGAAFASLFSYWFAAHGSCFLFKPLFKTGNMMTRALLFPKIW
ncbi:MAG: flippase [Desulfuromusa sp.]|nr:flippase [Desulfuromusa sp.]